MDFASLIEKRAARFRELEAALAAPDFYDNPQQARELAREHARLKAVLDNWQALQKAQSDLAASHELAATGDAALAELAREEIAGLEERIRILEHQTRVALLPPEPEEERNAIVEIRAGAGGNEAALFAADLYRMYCRYAEAAGLKVEQLEASPSDLGGFKEIIFKVSGEDVFKRLKYESGVHRVQRVPATEAQGRIHTSTATVAVLPEAQEVDLEINPDELRIEVCRAGGPGGQGVNTTDSAVQVLHIPSGMIVRCQDARSQQKNKEKALNILRSRLLAKKRREEAEKYAAQRKRQVGTGDRSEKVRTYNFPQNRVTDHRIGLTLHCLERFIDGDLGEMLTALQADDLRRRLEQAEADH